MFTKNSICVPKTKEFDADFKSVVTFNVSVVYMAQDVIILMRANPLQGTLAGVSPKNRYFSGS